VVSSVAAAAVAVIKSYFFSLIHTKIEILIGITVVHSYTDDTYPIYQYLTLFQFAVVFC